MEYTQESLRELAERIYDLDAEVYSCLGSSLGRVFNRDRERCVTELVQLMMQRDSGHQIRSELALISNMARTIPDKESRSMIMRNTQAFCMRSLRCRPALAAVMFWTRTWPA